MEEKKDFALSEAFLEGKHSLEYDLQDNCDLISPDKLQSPTAAENSLKVALINRLNQQAYCHISHQEFLVIKVSTLKKILLKHQRYDLLKKVVKKKFLLLRPDFFCCMYGFAIEVDGSIHHNNSARLIRDDLREYIFAALNIHLFRISNDQIYDLTAKNRFLNDIFHHIGERKRTPDFQKKYSSLRKQLSVSRKYAREQDPTIAKLIGNYKVIATKKENYPSLPNLTEIQFGGYRIKPLKK
jgi:very-short-patch-repair endonuclease